VYDRVFQPIRVAGVEIPNRIVRAAHGTGLGWVDQGNDLMAYHSARARGGVGLIVLEHGGTHPSTSSLWPFYDESIIEGCRRFSAAVHEHGTKVFVQITHRGSSAPNPLGQPLSASDVPNPWIGLVPRPLRQVEIDEIVRGFADAATNAQRGGIDGVELHGAHGYLIGQFLSPATNHRTDHYGGSVTNRARLLTEILDAVRDRVGPDYPVGVRLSADDLIDGGLRADDTAEIVEIVDDRIDFLDVSLGSYYRWHHQLATMEQPLGYELPTSEIVTQVCSKPTIVTGRIMTVEHAERIIESGIADMVSMVRALIADPDLVRKAREGREDEIRPCIGTSQGCVGQAQTTGRLGCVVNAAVGHEAHEPLVELKVARPRKVLIAGGGPAGMEAARIAALRGHDVELHEMSGRLGGQVAIAATAPHRADFGAITRWLEGELDRLGVKVHLRSAVDDDVVRASGAEVVVAATGSVPRRDGFQVRRPARPFEGHDLPHVYTSWDVFGHGGRAVIGETAVVFDDTGRFDALAVADLLVDQGVAMTFASAYDSLGANVNLPVGTVAGLREKLFEGDVTFMPNMHIERIIDGGIVLGHEGTRHTRELAADTVVVVSHNEPQQGLADLLVDLGVEVHTVGDAAGRVTLQHAIQDATRVGRAL